MFIAAFLPPTARVLGFAAGIAVTIVFHWRKIMTANLVCQLVLYAAGGFSFLRYAQHCIHRSLCCTATSARHILHGLTP